MHPLKYHAEPRFLELAFTHLNAPLTSARKHSRVIRRRIEILCLTIAPFLVLYLTLCDQTNL